MDVTFTNPGLDYSVESIMLFQNDAQSEWWRNALFEVYPQLSRAAFDTLNHGRQKDYLRDNLNEFFRTNEQDVSEKAIQYNEHWHRHKTAIEDAFSDAFGMDCHNSYNDIEGRITLNPVCPRFLDTRTFDVFYQYSGNGAVCIAQHEALHFVWFDVWRRHFKDDITEYETPNIKWIFSEAAVDAITRNDKRLYEKFPPHILYAYDEFYGVIVEGVPMLEALNDIYKRTDITGFMEKGYELILKHETEIRAHMK